jgi:hypothetical protein
MLHAMKRQAGPGALSAWRTCWYAPQPSAQM